MEYLVCEDKNGKAVYQNTIICDDYNREFIVNYSDHFLRWELIPHNKKARDDFKYNPAMFDWTYPSKCFNIVGGGDFE